MRLTFYAQRNYDAHHCRHGTAYADVQQRAAFLFRNYRANLGKWQSADPFGYVDGLNTFAYCGNDTINFLDWSGGWKLEGPKTQTLNSKTQNINTDLKWCLEGKLNSALRSDEKVLAITFLTTLTVYQRAVDFWGNDVWNPIFSISASTGIATYSVDDNGLILYSASNQTSSSQQTNGLYRYGVAVSATGRSNEKATDYTVAWGGVRATGVSLGISFGAGSISFTPSTQTITDSISFPIRAVE